MLGLQPCATIPGSSFVYLHVWLSATGVCGLWFISSCELPDGCQQQNWNPREEQQALTAELFGVASFGFKAAIVPVLGKLTKCSYLLCLCVCIFSTVCVYVSSVLCVYVILSASDNIPKADAIRTLIKDLWDTRMAKLRVSADSFVRQQEAHAKVGMAFLSPPSARRHCQPV